MRVQLLTVDQLLELVASHEAEDFTEAYSGVFLMAMGLVSAEVLRERPRGGTMAISFGPTLKHDVTQRHPLAGCAFFLPAGEGSAVTIGRSSQCNITVPEPSVSDLHCSLHITDEGVGVVDMGSKNGTSVNMRPVSAGQTAILADEDILTLGRYSFQVMSARTLYSELKFLQLVQK